MLVQQVRTSTSWLVTWAVLAALPFLAYGGPLVAAALADTPLAYLVWAVPIAFLWAVDNLRRLTPYRADARRSALLGGMAMAVLALFLVLAPRLWPLAFQADDLALLLWPLWALALAWLWFGPAVSGRLAAPLAFLLLAWPPLLSAVANALAGALLAVDRVALSLLAAATPRLVTLAPAGGLSVAHAGSFTGLTLSALCSGADALLAVVVVLPFVLSRSGGPVLGRAGLVLATAAAAVLANIVRLFLLVLAVVAWGPTVALRWPHAVLGVALFAAVAAAAVQVAVAQGLLPVEAPPGEDAVELPTPARTVGGAAAAVLAALAVLPGAVAPAGALGEPVPVRSLSAVALLPQVPGYSLAVAAFGPGGASGRYIGPGGQVVRAQDWLAPTLSALRAESPAACVACAGTAPAMVRPIALAGLWPGFAFASGPPAAARRVVGPRLDIEWTQAVRMGQSTRYLRVALIERPRASGSGAAPPAAFGGGANVGPLYAPLAPPARGRLPAALAPAWPRLWTFAQAFARALKHGSLL